MNEFILQKTGLTREYRVGREIIVALDGIDLAVDRGEFVAVRWPQRLWQIHHA